MADYTTIVPFILQEEGGLSKAQTDSARLDPVPDGSGYHTNRGVTWTTWKEFAPSLGYSDLSTSIKAWYAMSATDWGTIFKAGYWNEILGDGIKSQGAAEVLADWAWMSGPGTAVKNLQHFLNAWLPQMGKSMPLVEDGGMGPNTLNALNQATAINEKKFITDFSTYRGNWLKSLPKQDANQAGWASRVAALEAFALSTTGKTIIATVLILGTLGTFFFLNSISKPK